MTPLIALGVQNALLCVPLALVALVVTKLVHKPALAHALWLIVLIKLVTPPIFHVPILPADRVPPPPTPTVTDDVMVGVDSTTLPEFLPLNGLGDLTEPFGNSVDFGPIDTVTPPLTHAIGGRPHHIPAPEAPRFQFDARAIALSVWIAGSSLLFLIAILRVTRLVRLLRAPNNARAELRLDVQSLAEELGLRRTPKVIEVTGRFTPFVWALGPWSMLAIPSDLWDRLDGPQRTALLLHELAHLRRRDAWVRWLEAVATGLYWWHPALWLARRGLHQAEEQCCDAWVVWARPKAARAYASALVDALEFLSESRSGRHIAPLGASGLGRLSLITQRITLIMNGNVSRRLSWGGKSIVLALAMTCLAFVPTRAEPRAATSLVEISPASVAATADPSQDAPKLADDEISVLRDAVELAQSQARIKEAMIQRAKAQGDQARASQARFKRLNKLNGGYVSDDEMAKADAAVDEANANLAVAEAELQETMIRIKQAQRRFERAAASNQNQNKERLNPTPARPAGENLRPTPTAEQQTRQGLREIALAMHQYLNKNEHFPPVAIRAADGTPLLSWRVAILPFMGYEDLFAQFHLDEPWDGPHNKTLIEKMPRQFAASSKQPGTTDIRGVVAKECFFDPDAAKGRTLTDITDGTSNTVMCVANFTEMPWTQPETAQNAEPLGSAFVAVFADGSVRRFEVNEANRSKFKAIATIAGGEQINYDDFLVRKEYVKDSQVISDDLNKLKANISRQQSERKAAVLEQYTRAKQAASDAAERVRTMNNLKQIGLALHNYADANGRLPAAAIRDKDGKPLLSWRVAILPYLEQAPLYQEFHLDEPWDSEHNKALLAKMPAVFRTSTNTAQLTGVRGALNPGGIFDSQRTEGLRFSEIVDGTSNTIMAVNANSEIPWTQPDTAHADPFDPTFLALFADGSVRAVAPRDREQLSALLSAAGGERIELEDPRAEGHEDANAAEDRLARTKAEFGVAQHRLRAETIRQHADPKLAADRTRVVNNLKQIGIALHTYADANGRLPAAAIHGKDGKPLLSWRVAILPYLEQDVLYRQFHLDEPWDSEHNKTLIAKMPKVYGDAADGMAHVAAINTPGSVFDPARTEGLRFADVLDGTSNTVAAVAGGSEVWTKPDAPGTLPLVANPFTALFLDGSVQWIEPRDHDIFKALMTAAGGEVLQGDQYAPLQGPHIEQDRAESSMSRMMAAMRAPQQSEQMLTMAQQRIAQLEAELAALREEIAKLRAK